MGYQSYGAVGITMHTGWIEDFTAFYTHIGPCPSPKHSVDRINTNGNYEPGNVRWATVEQQTRNRKKSIMNTSGHTGVTKRVVKSGIQWVAFCKRLDGSDWTKTFSTSVYGDEAESLAVNYRQHMINCLNLENAGYTKEHGL